MLMDKATIAYLLLAYFILFIGITFVARTVIVWRRTGINPYALRYTDNAYDYIGSVFRFTVLLTTLPILISAFAGDAYGWLAPVVWLEHWWLQAIGLTLLLIALVWIVIAQAQMGNSWRIGIPTENIKTDLVQTGLFVRSRNPIFLGMAVALVGFFFILPNAVSLLVGVLGIVLMQIQVRLEEEHLLRLHGDTYKKFTHRVRRWI
jgi:protein-S-isoprenylcysteine O-methyltransferase Ste14